MSMPHPALELLQERLEDVFGWSTPEKRYARLLRSSSGSQEISDEELGNLSPGVHLLAGEVGLGKSTLLRALGQQALDDGQFVMPLSSAGHRQELEQELLATERRPTTTLFAKVSLILIRAGASTEGGMYLRLAREYPHAVILIACEPSVGNRLHTDSKGRWQLWHLQPLAEQSIRDFLGVDHHAPELLHSWANRGIEHQLIVGAPLFLTLFRASYSDPSFADALPRMSQVVAQYLRRLLKQVRDGRLSPFLLPILNIIARHVAWEGDATVSESQIQTDFLRDTALTSSMIEANIRLEAILEALVDCGLLRRGRRERYEFIHPLIARVIHAQALADQHYSDAVGKCPNEVAQLTALLVPAFSARPLETLDSVAASDSLLWLRGAAELSTDLLSSPEALLRIRRHIVPANQSETFRLLEQRLALMGGREGAPLMLSLIQGILPSSRENADLLGSILYFLERWEQATPEARLLQGPLRAMLPPPPPLPARHAFESAGHRYELARCTVTNQDSAQLFPGLSAGTSSQGLKHPRTEITWLAARFYAWWCRARLPTRTEWEGAAKGLQERVTSFRAANLPHTNADLVHDSSGQKTIPVDSPQLDRDPGLKTCHQLIGNVREWCEDGPENSPNLRWTLGGSYCFTPDRSRTVELNVRRPDVGFRLCFDVQGLASQRPFAHAQSATADSAAELSARSQPPGTSTLLRPPAQAASGQVSDAGIGPTAQASSEGLETSLFESLCKLKSSQMEEIILRLKLPREHLPDESAEPAKKAIAVVRLLEQEGRVHEAAELLKTRFRIKR